ncbi:hypothetical protein niasHS_005588 [Heterodera schachtii]|uniref:RRM domain-containing protein n=1 Tax=Heterodera schachtii TaxID=97005 RepID=A0ABD2JZL7_HETSC
MRSNSSNCQLKSVTLDEYMEQRTRWVSENVEEVERRTSPTNSAIGLCRFAPNLNEWHIRQLFSQCGTICAVTEFPKAFRVEFAAKRMAAFAIWSMNGKYWPNTPRRIICDWWKWKNDKTENQAQEKQQLTPNPSTDCSPMGQLVPNGQTVPNGQLVSIPPTVQNDWQKLTNDEHQKDSNKTNGEILILPLTNRSVLPFPASPFECLSTSESENEMANDEPTEAAKLAEEFATKNLTMKERMEAILKMISGRSGEEGAEKQGEEEEEEEKMVEGELEEEREEEEKEKEEEEEELEETEEEKEEKEKEEEEERNRRN